VSSDSNAVDMALIRGKSLNCPGPLRGPPMRNLYMSGVTARRLSTWPEAWTTPTGTRPLTRCIFRQPRAYEAHPYSGCRPIMFFAGQSPLADVESLGGLHDGYEIW